MALPPNRLMAMRRAAVPRLRAQLLALLAEGGAGQAHAAALLVPMAGVRMHLPLTVANFSDFMASLDHAARPGVLRDPETPPPQAFRRLPVAFHYHASSVRVSGEAVIRPHGQRLRQDAAVRFSSSAAMDFGLWLALWIAGEKPLGTQSPCHTNGHEE